MSQILIRRAQNALYALVFVLCIAAPFVVVNCVALAVLLRIDWENRQLARGLPA